MYGPEAHLKGRVDGEFGRISKVIHRASTGRYLSSIADIVDVLTAEREQIQRVRSADDTTYSFVDFMPDIAREDSLKKCKVVKARSMPCALYQSHHFSFQINDHRRKNFVGVGAYKNQITGITCRAHILPDVRAA